VEAHVRSYDPVEVGVDAEGADEPCVAEGGVLKVGFAHDSVGEIGPLPVGLRPPEKGAGQVGVLKGDAGAADVGEVGEVQAREREAGASEGGVDEVGAGEVERLAEKRDAGQVHAVEVGPGEDAAVCGRDYDVRNREVDIRATEPLKERHRQEGSIERGTVEAEIGGEGRAPEVGAVKAMRRSRRPGKGRAPEVGAAEISRECDHVAGPTVGLEGHRLAAEIAAPTRLPRVRQA
jgi:hypothetical protein